MGGGGHKAGHTLLASLLGPPRALKVVAFPVTLVSSDSPKRGPGAPSGLAAPSQLITGRWGLIFQKSETHSPLG